MTEVKVSAVLYQKNCHLKQWEEAYQGSLPNLLTAVKDVKQSVNDYLSHLISEDKNLKPTIKVTMEITEPTDEDFEDADVRGDSISGFIKDITTCNEKLSNKGRSDKKEVYGSTQIKKMKK